MLLFDQADNKDRRVEYGYFMHDNDHMHFIQRRIITSLANNAPLRFSQLLPPGMPNNTFSYHLKKLLEKGYISLEADGYMPTRKALKTVHFEQAQGVRKLVPRTISMIYITNGQGQVLLIKRHTQPFKHWFGIPSGLIHQNETIQEAARRELFEKTTIETTTELPLAGVLDFRYLEEESKDTFVHAIAFIYQYHYDGPKSKLEGIETRYGKLHWSTLDHPNVLPEVHKIYSLIKEGNFSVSSMTFSEPSSDPKAKKPYLKTITD
jgi:ADP-ribose pyrophosphatase YjhB (NUDIX family)